MTAALHPRLEHVYIPFSVVTLSLGAAVCFALSSVLQHRAAIEVPHEHSLRPSMLLRLVRDWRFFAGNGCDIAGYAMQFLALRRGALALVTPLLVTGLLFALPLGAVLARRRLRPVDWWGAVGVVGGLVVFLAVARPGPGHPRATTAEWLALFAVIGVIVGVLTLIGEHAEPRIRAVSLAAAAGVAFGLTSALTERAGHLLNRGWVHLLSHWTPYALAGVAAVAFLLVQSAFHAGVLELSLPVLTVAEPIVAILIGQIVFGEHINQRGVAPLAELLALAALSLGAFVLARSPATTLRPATTIPPP